MLTNLAIKKERIEALECAISTIENQINWRCGYEYDRENGYMEKADRTQEEIEREKVLRDLIKEVEKLA